MYAATIMHHSISRARVVTARSLPAIKRKAIKEFGDELRDYVIVIYESRSDRPDRVISTRNVGGGPWHDR